MGVLDFMAEGSHTLKKFWKVAMVLGLMAASAAVTFCITYQELGSALLSTPWTAKTEEISRYLDAYFVDEYDPEQLADGAAAGMLAATGDEWSYYISADDYDAYLEQMNNAYVGIGVTIQAEDGLDGFRVMEVTAGGPADQGGVQVNDVLTHVEGESVTELGQEETVNRVRGEEGTEVQLTMTRDGEPYDVTLKRSNVQQAVATYTMTEDKIAVITIANFDADCARQSIAAVEQAQTEGAKAIVFDVRNNPGGMKTELVELLDYLLPEGVLFRSVDYAGEEEIDESDAACVELPMAVLVNNESYSAAEFFAAALQEYDAAEIVGTQTYGKGNFQSTFPLSDGSAIAISIGKYYTPKGVSLTGVGITPDVVVELSDEEAAKLYYNQLPMEEDPQMQAALALFQEST